MRERERDREKYPRRVWRGLYPLCPRRVLKAHRLLYHPTHGIRAYLGTVSRAMQKKKKKTKKKKKMKKKKMRE